MRSPLLSLASERVLSEVEGAFPVFYQNERPTKNALEKKWIETTREKFGKNASDVELLQKTFDRMK